MRQTRILLYGATMIAASLFAFAARSDPVSVELFYTTFTGGPGTGANNVGKSVVTLNGSSLIVSNNQLYAATPGADGIIFNPFQSGSTPDLLVGGQSGAGTPGGACGGANPCSATNPAQISNVSQAGPPATVTPFGTTPGSGIANLGAYDLDSGPNPFGSGNVVFALCNAPSSPCGNQFSYFTSAGGVGTAVTVFGIANTAGVTGLTFDPSNSTWYYGAAGDLNRNGVGEFGTVTFGAGNTATLHPISGNFAAHHLLFDPYTGDIFLVGGNEIEQFDPVTGTVVATIVLSTEWQFDAASVDGLGHLFISSNTLVNGNNLVGIDYDCATPATCTLAGHTPGFGFLAANLDDVAPQAQPAHVPEPASLLLVMSGLAGLAVVRRRSRRRAALLPAG